MILREIEMKTSSSRLKAVPKAVPAVANDRDPPSEDRSRQHQIATAAYYRAKERGFLPGREMDDWLAAESDYDAACGKQP